VARAFEGIRVIDFSQVLAGPFATQHLALLGADVIKIESPGTGESGRHIRSADDPSPPNMSSVFLSVNAGKRSLSIDLKHASAKEVIHRLVRGADVIVQNYKAGVDMTTGLNAAIAICGALYRRQVTGEGQFLDVAMLDSAMSLLSTSYMMYMRTGVEPQLLGNQSQLKIPTADVFPTGEGHIQITALTEEQNRALCEALSLTELLDDERFATFDSRVENREAMCAHLTKAFATRTAVEWETLLGDHKVPASAVLTFPQALAQPQLKHRDFLMQPPAPQGFDEPITFFNAAYESPSDGPGTDLPPPGVGQHTDDVLDEFGFTPEEILALRNGGALGT
jgi:crotonobetainyl-CoA:carnitine CoA-transferase CaiB-like acyl-CoA transferase